MPDRPGRALAPDVLKLAACAGVIVIHCSGYGLTLFEAGSFDWLACAFWDSLARFAVPLFFMCTGALMLDPARRLTGRDIFRRYFLRVLVILLVWAWLYYVYGVVGTYIFTGWLEPDWLLNSVVHTLCFDHHVHLYYLQILLLIYALLPVLRALVRGATERELNWALIVWAALGICWPLLKLWPPISWMGGITPQYPLNMCWAAAGYALLGQVMNTREPGRAGRWAALFVLGFAVTFGGTVLLSLAEGELFPGFMEGMSPGPALMACGLFSAARSRFAGRESSPGTARLVKASFCVYLAHHAFVMAFRQLGFDLTVMPALIAVPVEGAAVFALSLAAWWVLSKIPFVNRHLI